MLISQSREAEIAVYAKCYEKPSYAMGVRRRVDVKRIIRELPLGSLLDIGTGRGETLDYAQAAGHGPLQGTEVVPALVGGRVVYGEAHQLPFDDESFDHVVSFDMLEHLTEQDVLPALREMFRVARKSVTVSASERTSIHEGRELHISRRPKAAWLKAIRECWGESAHPMGLAGASPVFRVLKP